MSFEQTNKYTVFYREKEKKGLWGCSKEEIVEAKTRAEAENIMKKNRPNCDVTRVNKIEEYNSAEHNKRRLTWI